MEMLGKTAALFFLAGGCWLLVAGCSNAPNGQFQSYDSLKKSAAPGDQKTGDVKREAPATGDTKPTANSPLVATSVPPASRSDASTVAANSGKPRADENKTAAVVTASASTANSPGKAPANASPAVSNAAIDRTSTTLAAPGRTAAAATPAAPQRKVQLLIPERKFKPEGGEGALRVSYDDLDLLKVLNMDPVTPDAATLMPAWLKNLDGQRIRIRGFMYPPFQQTGLPAFGLARDNQICCFGRNPKIYDVFEVVLRKGITTNYIPNRPFDVVGVFHIRPESTDGKMYQLYEMDDATVITK